MKIEDLNMHDSFIIRILLERASGLDVVDFYLKYIDDYSTMESSNKILRFSKCYKLCSNMNFGYSSPDAILTADEIKESELLNEVKESLVKMLGSGGAALKHYRIETSTTGSIIDIIAGDLDILEQD